MLGTTAPHEATREAATPFDDGFIPSSAVGKAGTLIRQPPAATLPEGLTVIPNAISDAVAREAYTFTSGRPSGSEQWGTYLPVVGEDAATGELKLTRRGVEPQVPDAAVSNQPAARHVCFR